MPKGPGRCHEQARPPFLKSIYLQFDTLRLNIYLNNWLAMKAVPHWRPVSSTAPEPEESWSFLELLNRKCQSIEWWKLQCSCGIKTIIEFLMLCIAESAMHSLTKRIKEPFTLRKKDLFKLNNWFHSLSLSLFLVMIVGPILMKTSIKLMNRITLRAISYDKKRELLGAFKDDGHVSRKEAASLDWIL